MNPAAIQNRSFDQRIEVLPVEEAMPICMKPGCENAADFEVSWKWRGGWRLVNINRGSRLYCTLHTIEWADRHGIAKIRKPDKLKI